jgi:DNA-binding response OmpR family regulator
VTKILLVEDTDDDAEIVTRALTAKKGWTVTRALTVKEALLHAALKPFDIAIIDYRLPDGDGVDLLDSLRAQKPGLPVLFLTGHGSEEVAMQAMTRGASDYMVKGPHYQRELPMRVAEVLERGEDIARVAAAVKHGAQAAPIPASQMTTAKPGPQSLNPTTLAKVVKGLVGHDTLGAAVFDAGGKALACKLPPNVEAEPLGASLVGAQFQAQQALRHVAGAGPPRAFIVEFEGGVLAGAAVPGPALVVLLFEASIDRTQAVRRVREAAQQVWEAGRA